MSANFELKKSGSVSSYPSDCLTGTFIRIAMLLFVSLFLVARPVEARETSAPSVATIRHNEITECDNAEAAGQAAYEAEDYSDAVSDWSSALRLAQLSGDAKLQADCATNLGALYVEMGDYDKAVPMLETALAANHASKFADPARERILMFLVSCCYVRDGSPTVASR